MRRWILVILVLLSLFLFLEEVLGRQYRPEISGNYERGERSYIDIFLVEEGEEADEELDGLEDIIEEELGEAAIYPGLDAWFNLKNK